MSIMLPGSSIKLQRSTFGLPNRPLRVRVPHGLFKRTESLCPSPRRLISSGTLQRNNAVTELPDILQVPQTELDSAKEGGSFAWTKQWYPVAIVDQLDPSVPHRIEVLGKVMVLWKSPEGEWSCLDDACPHRSGPLSQGRIDAGSGCLTCNYHGWQFSVNGSCADVPQSTNPEKTCGLRRSSVRSYPVQLAQGLVWIYPESGAEAQLQAKATPLATVPEVDDGSWWSWMPWLEREATVSFDFILENGFDFSHVPFVHHGLNGIKRTNSARGFDVKVTKMDPKWGIEVHATAPFTNAPASSSVTTYRAPSAYSTVSNNVANTYTSESMIAIYRTPVRPGVTRSFAGFWAKKPTGLAKAMFSIFPPWLYHVNALRFQDGDYVLMHEQERHVERAGGWKKAFYLPDPTDAAVVAMRRWFDEAGVLPFVGGNKLGPMLPREVQLDHYKQHVANCKHCQAGLRQLRLVSLIAAIAGVLGVISGGVGLTTGQWLPSPQISFIAAAVGAAFLGLSWKVKQYIQKYFFYDDYVHATNH